MKKREVAKTIDVFSINSLVEEWEENAKKYNCKWQEMALQDVIREIDGLKRKIEDMEMDLIDLQQLEEKLREEI
ncbi:MAG: hypothetical protein KGY70_16930 [Bacteroidales bacterium]|nr:hypothetical protein [Bacteroidales bacterium]